MSNFYIGTKRPKSIYIGTEKVKSLYLGTEKVWSSSRLPSEYQEVEWVQNSGTAYIDTGFTPNQNTSAEVKFQRITSSGGCGVFGCRVAADSKAYTFIMGSDGNYAFAYGNNNKATTTKWDTTRAHIIKREKNIVYLDNALLVTNTANTFTCNQHALLFTYYNNTAVASTLSHKVYYCKIWDNNTLVRELIPCYKIANNEIGFYDTVTKTFFGKQGSGSFTKGNNV